ncbi:MAG: hypothetical protein GXY63_06850 [Spirochaetales bacterium]|jgi:hypothetical protein|nr:hypothetical protein [Spirochaetota bacterium]NLV61325.1 hypothetical protein [Spirochaetales bacterium]
MENKHECKVIGKEDEYFLVLLDTGRREQVSKHLFSFTVSIGDELWAYLDDSQAIVYIEEKPAVEKRTEPVEKSENRTNVYVTHASAQGYDEGSFWGGFFLTFFFPVVGLIISLVLNKPETRRGAVRAIVVQLITGAVLVLIVFCSAMAY